MLEWTDEKGEGVRNPLIHLMQAVNAPYRVCSCEPGNGLEGALLSQERSGCSSPVMPVPNSCLQSTANGNPGLVAFAVVSWGIRWNIQAKQQVAESRLHFVFHAHDTK
jgi:hypothetical protein